MTNLPPATPTKSCRAARPLAELTKPVQALGMESTQRKTTKRMRAQCLSQISRNRKRMKMVPPTPRMDEVHISPLHKFRKEGGNGRHAENYRKVNASAVLITNCPNTKRIRMVPPTPIMDEVHTSFHHEFQKGGRQWQAKIKKLKRSTSTKNETPQFNATHKATTYEQQCRK